MAYLIPIVATAISAIWHAFRLEILSAGAVTLALVVFVAAKEAETR